MVLRIDSPLFLYRLTTLTDWFLYLRQSLFTGHYELA